MYLLKNRLYTLYGNMEFTKTTYVSLTLWVRNYFYLLIIQFLK